MKNIIKSFSFFLVLLCLFISFSGTVQAQTFELPSAGTLPDSPLYFLKSWGESIGTLFTFGDINKANRFLELSERRLAEVKALIEKEKEGSEKALERYKKQLSQSIERAERAKERGGSVDDVLVLISEQTLQHQKVLIDVHERVPEQAKPAIERAMDSGIKDHERALRIVSDQKREEITERLNEIKSQVIEKETAARERGIIVPKSLNERMLKAEEWAEIVTELPPELQKIFEKIDDISVKYKQTITDSAREEVLTFNAWQKGSKVRVEIKEEPTDTVVVIDLLTHEWWLYLPEANMVMTIDPEVHSVKEFETIAGVNFWEYKPVVIGNETISGFNALVIETIILDTKTTMWIAKDYGLVLKARAEREGHITTIEMSNIEFVDIPDEKFQMPAGALKQEFSPKVGPHGLDLEGMMKDFDFEEFEEIIKDLGGATEELAEGLDVEKMMEGIDAEGITEEAKGIMEGLDLEGMMNF